MSVDPIPSVLSAINSNEVVQTIVAIAVVAAGMIGGLIKNRVAGASTKKNAPRETPAPPVRRSPFPTAKPMPMRRVTTSPMQGSNPLPPIKRTVTRPTSPPVIAEFPVPTMRKKPPVSASPQPSIRRTESPARPVPVGQQPANRPRHSDRPRTIVATDLQDRTAESASTQSNVTTKRPAEKFVGTTMSSHWTTDPSRLTLMLRNPCSLRDAIVLSEILGPPVALREFDERR